MFLTNLVAEIKTLILYPIILFFENHNIYWKMGKKYGRTRIRQAADNTINTTQKFCLYAG